MKCIYKAEGNPLPLNMQLTKEQVKEIWFRDKAYLMKRPSIDRINRKKGYFYKNCRYLEFLDNLKRRVFKNKEIKQ